MSIDLHTHSTISDGKFSPEEIVVMAKEKGLSALAVSDHDSLEGSRRAVESGKALGLKVFPAAEISASHKNQAVHMLVYGIDLDNKALQQELDSAREYRVNRMRSIVGNINNELEAEGKPLLDLEPLLELGKEKPLGRPDIADYLIKLGYVQTRSEAFDRWLSKYNIPNKSLSVGDVCRLAHDAGGIAVLAHPGSLSLSLNSLSSDFDDHKKIISELKEQGLDGIEVYHPDHTEEVRGKYLALAESLDLVVTGGSDFHGTFGPADMLGSASVPDDVIERLENRIKIYH